MKGTDIVCTAIQYILPMTMRNWVGCKDLELFATYTSKDVGLMCTRVTRPILLPVYTTTGYASSDRVEKNRVLLGNTG